MYELEPPRNENNSSSARRRDKVLSHVRQDGKRYKPLGKIITFPVTRGICEVCAGGARTWHGSYNGPPPPYSASPVLSAHPYRCESFLHIGKMAYQTPTLILACDLFIPLGKDLPSIPTLRKARTVFVKRLRYGNLFCCSDNPRATFHFPFANDAFNMCGPTQIK